MRKNDLPTGGKLTVTPTFGEAMKTNFVIKTEGWTDLISQQKDLKYEFY